MANMHRIYMSMIERRSYNFSMRMFFELAQALETTPYELLKQAALLEKTVFKKRKYKLSNQSLKQ